MISLSTVLSASHTCPRAAGSAHSFRSTSTPSGIAPRVQRRSNDFYEPCQGPLAPSDTHPGDGYGLISNLGLQSTCGGICKKLPRVPPMQGSSSDVGYGSVSIHCDCGGVDLSTCLLVDTAVLGKVSQSRPASALPTCCTLHQSRCLTSATGTVAAGCATQQTAESSHPWRTRCSQTKLLTWSSSSSAAVSCRTKHGPRHCGNMIYPGSLGARMDMSCA